ncbi:MAG: GNAT family N-acetyltransferase [Nocardioidaceae bacterium]
MSAGERYQSRPAAKALESTPVQVQPLDVHDDQALQDYQQVSAEAESCGREYPTEWQLSEMTATLRRENTGVELEPFAAVADGRIVGAGLLEIPSMDNPHLAILEVVVAPPVRGQGIGSALVDYAVRRTTELGRRSVVAEVNVPLHADEAHPYSRFAARHGFTRRLVELHQVMDYPSPPDLLAELEQGCAAHCRDYRLVSWGDHCPDEYVEQFCALLAAMGDHAPPASWTWKPRRWDFERLRDTEARRIDQGRRSYTTVAVMMDGSLAGYTQLGVPTHDPLRIFQWDTLVLPVHRGHRLGMALKLANLKRAQAEHRDPRVLHTWNAEGNEPMLAVNGQLGFHPVERVEEWQLDLRGDASAVVG